MFELQKSGDERITSLLDPADDQVWLVESTLTLDVSRCCATGCSPALESRGWINSRDCSS
jgi:hypothetical protein